MWTSHLALLLRQTGLRCACLVPDTAMHHPPQFGLFHGDPHPGNIFAMRDGRIAYVDFGNVASLSTANKQVRSAGCPIACMAAHSYPASSDYMIEQ